MTGARAGRSLGSFRIATQMGATKAGLIGRGNSFVREDGTAVRIFNVSLFPNADAAQAASVEYKAGLKAELANDAQAAHDHYIAALNKGMSFSVLEANAAAYENAYEVAVKVETVTNKSGQNVIVLNQPKPIAVSDTTTAVATDMFVIPTAPATPAASAPATGSNKPAKPAKATK